MTVEKIWFDDSRLPLYQKILNAVSYFSEKYGIQPTYCKVSDKLPYDYTLSEDIAEEIGVDVRHVKNVLRYDIHVVGDLEIEQAAE